MVDLGGIVILHSDRGIVEGGQQILFDVLDLSRVVLEAVKHKAYVACIQL